jgi:hypothetical protein
MVTVDATCTTDMMKPSEKSESEETMTTRDAGLTQEQVEAAEVHAAGSSHCGEIKSKSAFSRDSTTKEENEQYIDTEREFHYFQGKKLNNDRFLNSWEDIGKHIKENVITFSPVIQKGTKLREKQDSPDQVRINTEGEYILFIDGTPFEGIQNTLGEVTRGERITEESNKLSLDPSPPAQ